MRTRIRAQQQRNEKGFAALAGMLVACAVALILASVMIPSIVEAKRVSTEVAAAEALNQIGAIETTYAHMYGAYVPVQFLTGVLPSTAVPASCSNSFLLNGGQTQAPEGYAMRLSGSPATTFSCPGVPGYSNYSLLLTPNNPLEAQRSFFMAQDGVLHFNDSAPAGPADPVYTITASNGVVTVGGAGSNNNPSSGSSVVQLWNPSSNVTPGSTWILSSNDPAGGTCSPSNGSGYVGVFVALPTAVSGEDPCQPTSAADFLYSGNGTLTYVPAMPACGGVLTGSLGNFNIPFASGINIPWTGTSGTLVTITPPNACGNFTTFILQEQAGYTPGSGTENPAQFGMTESINQTSIGGCMQGNGVPVSYGTNAFNQCQSTWGSINLSRGDTLYLWVAGAPPSFSIQTITWTLR